MTGLEICALIMTTIRDGTTSNWFTETFRVGKAFSRTRKLSMPLVMLFLMFKTKASISSLVIVTLMRAFTIIKASRMVRRSSPRRWCYMTVELALNVRASGSG